MPSDCNGVSHVSNRFLKKNLEFTSEVWVLFSTTQGKKIKFLTKTKERLTNEEKLINQLNDATNSSDLTNPSTY